MVTESTSTLTVPNTKATGKMTFKMAKAWRAGKMVAATKVATKKA